MRRRGVWYVDNNVLKEHTASTCGVQMTTYTLTAQAACLFKTLGAISHATRCFILEDHVINKQSTSSAYSKFCRKRI